MSPAPRWPALLRPSLSPARADALVVMVLLLSGGIFVQALPAYADVSLWDETSYLDRALHLTRDGLPDAQYGPFYSVHLWLLSRFIPDPLQVSFANQMLVTVLLPPAFFVLLRAARVTLSIAWPLAAFTLLSYANLHLEQKLAHLTLIVLMLFAAGALRAATLSVAWRWLLAGTLLASYFRPENFLAFLIVVPCWLWSEVRERRGAPFRFPWPPVALAGVVTLALCRLGPPAFAGGSGREMLAFSQHFAIRWVEWNHSPLNPGYDHEAIVSQVFGSATSVPQALRANPAAFLHHVAANAAGVLLQAPRIFLLHFALAPRVGGAALKPWDAFVLLLLLALLAAASWWRWRKAAPAGSRHWCLLPLLVPPALSAVLIFPKYPYLLTLIFVGAAILLGWLCARTPAIHPALGWVLAGAAAQLLLIPSLAQTEFAQRERPVFRLVGHLRDLHLQGELHILEEDGGYSTYLGPSAQFVKHFEKRGGFDAFRAAQGINVVIADDYLEHRDVRYKDDPEWQRFLREPGTQGFVKVAWPEQEHRLYVRRELLPAAH